MKHINDWNEYNLYSASRNDLVAEFTLRKQNFVPKAKERWSVFLKPSEGYLIWGFESKGDNFGGGSRCYMTTDHNGAVVCDITTAV